MNVEGDVQMVHRSNHVVSRSLCHAKSRYVTQPQSRMLCQISLCHVPSITHALPISLCHGSSATWCPARSVKLCHVVLFETQLKMSPISCCWCLLLYNISSSSFARRRSGSAPLPRRRSTSSAGVRVTTRACGVEQGNLEMGKARNWKQWGITLFHVERFRGEIYAINWTHHVFQKRLEGEIIQERNLGLEGCRHSRNSFRDQFC